MYRENDVLRRLVRTYAYDDVHWCYECHIPMESDETYKCGGCSSMLCHNCNKYDSERGCDQCGHDLCPNHTIQICGSCNERWCDGCRQKDMVQCSHVLESDNNKPHLMCETCAAVCAGCSTPICRSCADICEYCDDYDTANMYCQQCRAAHWCVECDMVLCHACEATCVQCGHIIHGSCKECATQAIHDLDECDEVMCRSCRRETLTQIYGNLTYED